MVSTILRGRCGNQFLQIATCIGYAIKHDMVYSIPKLTLNPSVWPAYFKDKFETITIGGYPSDIVTYKEPSHSYTPIPPFVNVLLDGFWQSEKYFNHCRDYILKVFGFKDIGWENGIASIHIRRGDYLLYPDKHPVVTVEYLIRAIERLKPEGVERFLVFSDDLPYFETIREYLPKGVGYGCMQRRSELDELMVMARCTHNIISNSTFSWVGAWLNNNPNKIVISPSKSNWFGPGNAHLSTDDLIPDSWHQITY